MCIALVIGGAIVVSLLLLAVTFQYATVYLELLNGGFDNRRQLHFHLIPLAPVFCELREVAKRLLCAYRELDK